MQDWNKFKETIEKTIEKSDKLSKVNLDTLIDYAEWFVKNTELLKISTHQIRRFFDAIKNIKMSKSFTDKEKAKLLMLRPQLANASAKQSALKDLTNICTAMIKKVNDREDFNQFANFFESLVAFHKVYAKD